MTSLLTRSVNAAYVSPSAIEFALSQHEKSRPSPGNDDAMDRWLVTYNILLGKLHKARH